MKTMFLALVMLLSLVPSGEKYLVLVNKDNPFPVESEKAVIGELAPIFHTRRDGREMQYMQKDAATSLDALLAAADEAGYTITVTSAYRSREYQAKIYGIRREKYIAAGYDADTAAAMTERYIAPPGYSEHHTGLAVDMHSMASAETSFADTDEYKWLIAHAAEYGFILRYPRGKEDVTGYVFEPWHFRYVGACASQIMENGLTLEEFSKEK